MALRLGLSPVLHGAAFRIEPSLPWPLRVAQAFVRASCLSCWPDERWIAGRTRLLRERGIVLFDSPGRTADLLKAAGLSFTELNNLDAVGVLSEGTVIVGEGVSFASQRGLPDVLFRAAAKGVSVLCLAPVDGVLPLPDGNDREIPCRLDLRSVTTTSSPNSTSGSTPGAGPRMARRSRRAWSSGARARVSSQKSRLQDRGGPGSRSIFRNREAASCCVASRLMSHWDHGPTPRFLLSRAIDRTGRVDMRA